MANCQLFFTLLLLISATCLTDGFKRLDRDVYRTFFQCSHHCSYPGARCEHISSANGWCCIPEKGDCGIPFSPEHGDVATPSGTHVGSEAIYTCHDGYHMIGEDSRVCQGSGIWSGRGPNCVKDNHCEELAAPEHGDVTLTGNQLGDTATFVCDLAFYMSKGTSPRVCESIGEWSGEDVVCSPIVCPQLSNPEHGTVSTPNGREFEDEAFYSCDAVYILNGDSEVICESGASWSKPPPTCSLIDCGEQERPCDGNVSAPSTTLDSTATYSCFDGYQLVGDVTRTCTVDGWNGSIPCCDRGTCPEGYFRLGERCYRLMMGRQRVEFIQGFCMDEGGDLAIFETEEEFDLVRTEMFKNDDPNNANADKFYVGARWSSANGRYEWLNGDPIPSSFWNNPSPSSNECVRLDDINGLDTESCTTRDAYLCERDVVRFTWNELEQYKVLFYT